MLAVEIHDAGLRARLGDGRSAGPSPGYALVEDGRVLTGEAAWRRARLKPRLVHSRYWLELSQQPLEPPLPSRLSTADLAHAQLCELLRGLTGEAPRALLAVPATASPGQLGLLLGILRACGVRPAGMVDAALVALAGAAQTPEMLHLDLQLHRVLLTRVVRGQMLERQQVRIAEEPGLSSLWDLFAREVARGFVRATRYDPFHEGDSEQQLYLELPGWLERLSSQPSIEVSLAAASGVQQVELVAEPLAAAAEEAYARLERLVSEALRAGSETELVLSARAACLPGLAARLGRRLGREPLRLEPEAAVLGLLEHAGELSSDAEALPLVTELSLRQSTRVQRPRVAEPPARSGPTPTHLLYRGLAHPLDERPLLVGTAPPEDGRRLRVEGATAGISRHHCRILRSGAQVLVEDLSRYGSYLNGARIEGRVALAAGDRLRLGSPGIELELIATVDDDEAPAG